MKGVRSILKGEKNSVGKRGRTMCHPVIDQLMRAGVVALNIGR